MLDAKEIGYYIDLLEKRVEEAKRAISVFEKTIKDLKAYTFEEGDVVVSKTYGTGIVTGMGVGDDRPSAIDAAFADKIFIVLATRKGYVRVVPEDIMPYTKTSKVLYERG